QQDLLTGLLENGRPETLDGERLLGLFLNAVCVRQRLHGQSLGDLARECLSAERALLPHRRMPLAVLQQARGGEALFDTVFNYTHFHIYQGIEALPEVTLLDAFASEQTYYDLTAQFNRDHVSGRVRLVLDYRASRFEPVQIHAIGDTYRRVLQRFVDAVEAPENADPLWSSAERHMLLVEWQDSGAVFASSRGLHRELEQRAVVAGASPALLTSTGSLSYAELDRRANRLARRWRSRGLGPEDGVAIHMERSPELLIALLATLKCGAFYVPLDPTAPHARLSFMLEDSGVRWLISDQEISWLDRGDGIRSLKFRLEDQAARSEAGTSLDIDAAPGQAAYLIYTSGSTGRPKGVVGSHGATLNRLQAMWDLLPYGVEVEDEVACQKTFLSFVDAVAEIFSPLLAGVPSRIVGDETVRDHLRFLEVLAEAGVTRLVLVPSLLRVLLSEPNLADRLPRLHYWFTSGETLPPDLARLFYERLPGRRLFNIYGSSEVAADVTWHEVEPGATSTPIGRPLANHAIRLLDRELRPMRLGAEGQIAAHGF
ncbi:MAG: AMP-binding protein, partial [Acidobacteriota bacterium]